MTAKWVPVDEYARDTGRSVLHVMQLCIDVWFRGEQWRVRDSQLYINPSAVEAWQKDIDRNLKWVKALQGGIEDLMAVCELVYTPSDGWLKPCPPDIRLLYAMRNGHYLKVGISGSPEARLAALQSANPIEITLERAYLPIPELDSRVVEAVLHKNLARFHVRGEWFHIDALGGLLKFETAENTAELSEER